MQDLKKADDYSTIGNYKEAMPIYLKQPELLSPF